MDERVSRNDAAVAIAISNKPAFVLRVVVKDGKRHVLKALASGGDLEYAMHPDYGLPVKVARWRLDNFKKPVVEILDPNAIPPIPRMRKTEPREAIIVSATKLGRRQSFLLLGCFGNPPDTATSRPGIPRIEVGETWPQKPFRPLWPPFHRQAGRVFRGMSSTQPRHISLYTEISLLGIENQPYYYDRRSERMPMMAGINHTHSQRLLLRAQG